MKSRSVFLVQAVFFIAAVAASAQQSGAPVLMKAQEALGNLQQFQAPDSFQLEVRTTTFGGISFRSKFYYSAPEFYRMEIENDLGKQVYLTTGPRGWMHVSGLMTYTLPLDAPQKIMMVMTIKSLIRGNIMNFAALAASSTYAGSVERDGRKMERVTLVNGLIELYFDAETSLPVLIRSNTYAQHNLWLQMMPALATTVQAPGAEEIDPGIAAAASEVRFADWHDVSGARLPRRIEIMTGGVAQVVFEVVEMKVNEPMDMQLFSRPEELSAR